MALVIVESPAKAKTINKYLGKQYIVKASLGHVKDLPKNDLAVDVEHGFEPRYEVIEGKKKLIAELKQASRKVDEVYLAADPDREGEAICYHLQEELRNGKKAGPRFYRVMFNEITKRAVQHAFEKPGQVNINLVDAQQARRVLDRLVGYKISPLLWDKVRRGLSGIAGPEEQAGPRHDPVVDRGLLEVRPSEVGGGHPLAARHHFSGALRVERFICPPEVLATQIGKEGEQTHRDQQDDPGAILVRPWGGGRHRREEQPPGPSSAGGRSVDRTRRVGSALHGEVTGHFNSGLRRRTEPEETGHRMLGPDCWPPSP